VAYVTSAHHYDFVTVKLVSVVMASGSPVVMELGYLAASPISSARCNAGFCIFLARVATVHALCVAGGRR